MTDNRKDQYYSLIEALLNCPNGEEPAVLDAQPDLLDAGLVQTMIQVASMLAHQDNQDGARCLVHIARELAKQLGLYPQLSTEEACAEK
jgi:hypothetical protein